MQLAQFIRDHHDNFPDQPFFQYVAHTAPHWPLHAHNDDIGKYAGKFDASWDELRERRMARLIDAGIIDSQWELTDRDPTQPEWTDAEYKEWMQEHTSARNDTTACFQCACWRVSGRNGMRFQLIDVTRNSFRFYNNLKNQQKPLQAPSGR